MKWRFESPVSGAEDWLATVSSHARASWCAMASGAGKLQSAAASVSPVAPAASDRLARGKTSVGVLQFAPVQRRSERTAALDFVGCVDRHRTTQPKAQFRTQLHQTSHMITPQTTHPPCLIGLCPKAAEHDVRTGRARAASCGIAPRQRGCLLPLRTSRRTVSSRLSPAQRGQKPPYKAAEFDRHTT